jgi:hypothetical protein
MPVTLNENTSIPLKIVVPLVLAIMGATYTFSIKNSSILLQLREITTQLNMMNEKLGESWSVKDMNLWVSKLQRDNPDAKIPDANEGRR